MPHGGTAVQHRSHERWRPRIVRRTRHHHGLRAYWPSRGAASDRAPDRIAARKVVRALRSSPRSVRRCSTGGSTRTRLYEPGRPCLRRASVAAGVQGGECHMHLSRHARRRSVVAPTKPQPSLWCNGSSGWPRQRRVSSHLKSGMPIGKWESFDGVRGISSTARCCASTAAVVMMISFSVSKIDPVSATPTVRASQGHRCRRALTGLQ